LASELEGTDQLLVDIASYVHTYNVTSENTLSAALYCVLDALGCGLLALEVPECTKLLGPIVPGIIVPDGVHVPGTSYVLDPVQGAFNLGCLFQWLGLSASFDGGKDQCNPSDNLAAVLSVAEYVSRRNVAHGKAPLTVKDVLVALVKAAEIHGVLSLEDTFGSIHLDHVALVKVASTAVAAHLLGATIQETVNAISNAFIDRHPLATYRHTDNEGGSRGSWAAGDAASRAVQLALMALKGEMGYPTALTAKLWGFYGVYFSDTPSKTIKLQRPLGFSVIESIVFKSEFPTEAFKLPVQKLPSLSSFRESLEKRFVGILGKRFGKRQVETIGKALTDKQALASTSVEDFMELFVV